MLEIKDKKKFQYINRRSWRIKLKQLISTNAKNYDSREFTKNKGQLESVH